MGSRNVMVLDAGTSAARCFVFDENGQIIGSRTRQWTYLDEEDAPSLARAFDPQALWHDIRQLIAGALKESGVPPAHIAALSVTGQRQAIVFLDDAGHEIYAGPNLDLRAVFEGAAIDQQMRERVYQTTGHLPSFFFTPAKLRWFQHHRPDAYGRIACVLTLADWVAWRLTGALASERTLAGEAGLLDIHRRDWCADLLNDMGIAIDALPLVEASKIAGAVNRDAAGETGLAEATPVVVAGADTQCGLLGMGVAHEHQVGIVAGWSAPLQMVTGQPVLSPTGKTWAGCFLHPCKWVLESNPGDVGNSYRWLAEMLWRGGEDAFQQMDALANAAPLGSEGAVAFLGPSRMDMASPGMRQGGLLFPVPLTFSEMGRGNLIRASLEASAYAIRANLEQIEELADVQATDITVGGGMTRTKSFVRLLTDVLGREIRVSSTAEVSAIGAYLCARTALGDFTSLEEVASSVRPRLQVRRPDPRDSAEYQDYYEGWVRLSGQLEDVSL